MSEQSDGKKLAGCLFSILYLFFIMPLWYYLMYRILQAVHADTAMWVCYWVYMPLGFLVQIIKTAWEEMK